MAFETITGGNWIKLKDLEDGKSFEGYLLGVEAVDSKEFPGTKMYSLKMQKEGTDTPISVSVTGNAKYFAQNIAAATGLVPSNPAMATAEQRDATAVGHLVRITRQGVTVNKKNKRESANFLIQVDRSKTKFAVPAAQSQATQTFGDDEIPF